MLEDVIEYIQYDGNNIDVLKLLSGCKIYAKLDITLQIAGAQWCFIEDVHDCRKDKIIHRRDYIVRDANGVRLMTASEFEQKYGEVE